MSLANISFVLVKRMWQEDKIQKLAFHDSLPDAGALKFGHGIWLRPIHLVQFLTKRNFSKNF